MVHDIRNFVSSLCKMTNRSLETFVQKGDFLFFFHYVSSSCCVVYDTQEERITAITLVIINRNGLTIEIDPIAGYVRGKFLDELDKCARSARIKAHIAEAVVSSIQKFWDVMVKEKAIDITAGESRYITVELLG